MNLFTPDEKTHLGVFYLYSAITSTFGVVWVYWIVYLLDEGFSYSVIGFALAVNGGAMAFCHIPSGALADAISRKYVVLTGLIGFALVMASIPSIGTPLLLTIAFAVWGLPIALASVIDAWIVDNLRAQERSDLIKEYYVKTTAISSLGFILAGVLAGVVVTFLGMRALWYVNAGAEFAAAAVLATQVEHFKRKEMHLRKSFIDTYTNICEGAHFVAKHRNVLFIVVALFFMVAGFELMSVCSKPFLDSVKVPREYFGYLSAINGIVCVGVPFMAKRLVKLLKKEIYYLSGEVVVFGLLFITALVVKAPLMASILFVIIFLKRVTASPILEPFFQGFLPTSLRATVGAIRYMVTSVALLISDFTISAAADVAGPQRMLALGGVVMLPAAAFYLSVKKEERDKYQKDAHEFDD